MITLFPSQRGFKATASFLYWVMGRSQILQYYNVRFPPRIREEHIQLTARIITEARTTFHQQFPDEEFDGLLYPAVRLGHRLRPYLPQAEFKYLDYARVVDWPD